MKKGIFCISIDTELLWGRINNPKPFIQPVKKTRYVIKKLLSLFEKYKLPATWAIVGELFNEGDALWHGPDIIQMIKKAKNQEIACHSFSHLIIGEKSCPPKQAKEEIKNCLKVAKPLQLKSFVFPKNIIDHLKILKKYGFTSFRGPEPYWFRKIPKLGKIFQILDFLLLISPPVSHPARHPSGLINIPGSMYYVCMRKLRQFIPIKFRIIKAQKGLDRAAKKGKLFHLWFHPLDLVQNSEKMLLGLETIIRYAYRLRSKGELEIKSMEQIAKNFKN